MTNYYNGSYPEHLKDVMVTVFGNECGALSDIVGAGASQLCAGIEIYKVSLILRLKQDKRSLRLKRDTLFISAQVTRREARMHVRKSLQNKTRTTM